MEYASWTRKIDSGGMNGSDVSIWIVALLKIRAKYPSALPLDLYWTAACKLPTRDEDYRSRSRGPPPSWRFVGIPVAFPAEKDY